MDRIKQLLKIFGQREGLGSLRRLVQTGFAIFCLYAGWRFYYFYLWATGQSALPVSRPPAVEGFLPISALVSLKRLVLTGNYDSIHPAGLTIFIAALTIGLLLRKGFCGWICPVGFVSNLIESAGRRLRLRRELPIWLNYPLLSIKYLLLAFFSYLIVWKMDIQQIEAFHNSPYNLAVDARMLLFFLEPSRFAAIVMIFLVLISFVLRNFWCRYLCPYGALLGLPAMVGPLQIKRDPAICIDCKKCEKACPASLHIAAKQTVRSGACIGCLECVAVCPQQDCLTLASPWWRKLPPIVLPLAVLTVFLLFWAVALLTGHWYSAVPPEVFQKLYTAAAKIVHPAF